MDRILDLVDKNNLILLADPQSGDVQIEKMLTHLAGNLSQPIVFGGNSWQLLDKDHSFTSNQIVALSGLDQIVKFFQKHFPGILADYSDKGRQLNLLEIVKSLRISHFPLLIKHNNLIIARFEDKLCYTYSKPMNSHKEEDFQMASWSALYVAANSRRIFESLTVACWQVNKKLNILR